ncbi:hypothetical protein T484DRAFT_1904098 [Baffinella frigidus]|nr:hypothetical protein T484DRAFT_1904098 [Cryptophyta sp. CCMP2293]
MAAKADTDMEVHKGMDAPMIFQRLNEAFKKVLDKTFEQLPFDDFAAGFGLEMSGRQRDLLFDVYTQFVAMMRSNTEEEFNVIVFQSDLADRLVGLSALVEAQPEDSGGVAHAAHPPSVLMRAQRIAEKDEERARLEGRLADLDKENDALRPQVHAKQDGVAHAAADLRARKARTAAMTSTLANPSNAGRGGADLRERKAKAAAMTSTLPSNAVRA